jgi:methionyl-tRNA formyltransferase
MKLTVNMMQSNYILYANRNTGMCVLSYLLVQGYNIKVITEDEDVKTLCGFYGIEIVTLETMGEFDLFICCHGKKIIKSEYLQSGKFINIHPCLFKYKGHNPIKRYINNGDSIGTVESQYLIEEVDAGDVIYKSEFTTGKVNTYAEFYNIAIPHYFKVIHETLKKIGIQDEV